MKIICAGYPKTGSKSCSTALRHLGYNVADYMETLEFLSEIWAKFVQGHVGIDAVIEEYHRHGFDVNQDIPGNVYWEELYKASSKLEKTKVILTVRDSPSAWWTSYANFTKQEAYRQSIFGYSISKFFMFLSDYGYMGPELIWMQIVGRVITKNVFVYTFFNAPWNVERFLSLQAGTESIMKQRYMSHNLYVKNQVPEEDLLVWNVKEGWDPLCKFLEKTIPEEPFPHANKTGDMEYIDKYAHKSDFFERARVTLRIELGKSAFKLVLIASMIYLGKRNEKNNDIWNWLAPLNYSKKFLAYFYSK